MDAATAGIITTGSLGFAGIVATFFAPTWTQTKMERRREARDLQRARRLVADELSKAHSWLIVLTRAIEEKRESTPALNLSTDEWDAHKGPLATDVPDAVWTRLRLAYAAIWAINRRYESRRPVEGLTAAARSVATSAEEAVRDARNALGEEPLHEENM